jgi:ProP effector
VRNYGASEPCLRSRIRRFKKQEPRRCPKQEADLAANTRQPLKIDIFRDVVERPPLTRAEAKSAFNYYCGGFTYLRALLEGAPRLDLDGAQVGVVTAEEAEHARDKLARLKAALKARSSVAEEASS